MKPNIYFFQWPSDLGGADTRLRDLIKLCAVDYNVTVVPNDEFRLGEERWTSWMESIGVSTATMSALPEKLDGFAFSCCNFRLFSEKERLIGIKARGLKFIWANDMMWHTEAELSAIRQGLVDVVLYTSPFHAEKLHADVIASRPLQPMRIVKNYIDASHWPMITRPDRQPVMGKVSRPDVSKFSDDLPMLWQSAAPLWKYDIMGWDEEVAKKFSWHQFDKRWKLRAPLEIPVSEWLAGVDVFCYNGSYSYIENQSRAVVEAQLSGMPVVAPSKWNFPNMVWNQRTGFLVDDLDSMRSAFETLKNPDVRWRMGALARECALRIWCDEREAKKEWHSLIAYAAEVR